MPIFYNPKQKVVKEKVVGFCLRNRLSGRSSNLVGPFARYDPKHKGCIYAPVGSNGLTHYFPASEFSIFLHFLVDHSPNNNFCFTSLKIKHIFQDRQKRSCSNVPRTRPCWIEKSTISKSYNFGIILKLKKF